jgi:predicted Holliday junction resolvase-like endonuclease
MSLAMMVSLFTILLLLAMWGGLKAPVSMAIRTTLNRKVEDQTDRAEERHKLTEWIKDQPVEAKKEARSGLSSRHPRR